MTDHKVNEPCRLLCYFYLAPTLSQADKEKATFPVPNTRLTCHYFQPFH